MKTRLELQAKLEELLGSRNVYYQPPSSITMSYPAIVYYKSNITKVNANNSAYLLRARYEITVIDKLPDNPVIMKLLELEYSSYDRHYISDNLHHDTLTLYY